MFPEGHLDRESRRHLMERSWNRLQQRRFSPQSYSSSLMYLCPLRAAWWRGVYPVLSTQFTLGPLQILLRKERTVRHKTHSKQTLACEDSLWVWLILLWLLSQGPRHCLQQNNTTYTQVGGWTFVHLFSLSLSVDRNEEAHGRSSSSIEPKKKGRKRKHYHHRAAAKMR